MLAIISDDVDANIVDASDNVRFTDNNDDIEVDDTVMNNI